MSFALDLRQFNIKTNQQLRLVVRKIALELLRRVVLRTPVGNPDLWQSRAPRGYVGGFLRGNWQVTIGTPAGGTIDQFSTSAEQVIAEQSGAVSSWDGDGAIFIVNNAPYSMRIERGWSSQAPQGMVQITLEEYPYIVQQEAQ